MIVHFNKMLGFAGIRVQRKKLKSILKGELRKALSPTQQKEIKKMTNFYHRQLKVGRVKRLGVFIQQMTTHQRSIKQQLKQYRDNLERRAGRDL